MSLYADHAALQDLSTEQLAELALYGLRYKALGAKNIDFNDPTRLDVYWTGDRMVKEAVKIANKARASSHPLELMRHGEAVGHLACLFNCSVIDNATYMEQYKRLGKTKVS
ncbi:hypothetical protein DND90_16275 [Pseudomonas syringae pv. maculicola]|nr:hypothetical protein DND90_16275 [Pseudomonas syringae pv. maculicola]